MNSKALVSRILEAAKIGAIAVFVGSIVVGVAVYLYFAAGITVWASAGAYELIFRGIEGKAVVVSCQYVPSTGGGKAGMSKPYHICTLQLSNEKSKRQFWTPKPLGKVGDVIPVRYLKQSPHIFAPYGPDVGYIKTMTLLARVSMGEGSWMLLHIVLVFVLFFGVIPYFLIRWYHYLAVKFGGLIHSIDDFLKVLLQRIIPKASWFRNKLFIIALLMLGGLVLIKLFLLFVTLSLKSESWSAVTASAFLLVGAPLVIVVVRLIGSLKKEEILPNVQQLILQVVTIGVLAKAVQLGAIEVKAFLTGSDPKLLPYLLEVLKVIFL